MGSLIRVWGKWLKRHWRGISRVVAVLLLFASVFFGYWWFYKLAPARRTLDPEWFLAHSEQEYWREVQKGIHRGMWTHDDGFTVGQYGDKRWAEWIIDHVEPGSDMSCMGRFCHSASSMRYLTNQDVGEEADAWLAWWEENKSKSQLEWMADGFRSRGFAVDVPPTVEQRPVLLELLGIPDTDAPGGIPREMKYNAYRCLRDSGFEPIAFAVANPVLSPEVERGLLAYAQEDQAWPVNNREGILPFGPKGMDAEEYLLPAMLKSDFQIMANASVFGPLVFGVALLLFSFRKSEFPPKNPPIGNVR